MAIQLEVEEWAEVCNRVQRAEAQRDVLREALQELLNLHDAEVWVKEPWDKSMEQARAALKATEE